MFCDTDAKHWYNPLLRPGFQHVWAFKVESGLVMALSPQLNATDIDVVLLEEAHITSPNSTVLQVDIDSVRQSLRVPWLLTPFTCVEQVKALLGLRHWCVTPWQLFKVLTMMNEKGIKTVIADAVAEGMQTAHMNKTPSEVEQEHPDMGPTIPIQSLVNQVQSHEQSR